MRAHRLGRLAILLGSLLPLVAQGQSQPIGPLDEPMGQRDIRFSPRGLAIGQQDRISYNPDLADVNPDVLLFRAGASLLYHDNIFALHDGVKPTKATYGGSGRSDTQLKALLGARFDRQVSLQRFQLEGELEPTKFMEFSRFDHVAYNLGANWDWAIGRPWFGTLGLRLTERLSHFDAITITDKNKENRNRYYATAGLRVTPDWSIVGGVDLETARNSDSGLDYYDYDFLGYELGARYARDRQSAFELVWRHIDGNYPNRQLVDSSGNVLPNSIDNEFKEDELLLRLQYHPSNDSRIAGHIGYAKRKYDNQGSRDYSGVVAGIDLDWAPTGAFQMRTSLLRSIQSEDLLVSNHVTQDSIVLRPMLQLTGRTALEGLANYSVHKYDGDPFQPATVRKDDYTILGIDMVYQYSRTITGRAGLRYVKRDSNNNNYDYDDTSILLSVVASF